ncbi:MAG: FAD-binding oxidoreductase [Deltaproteobacteria bacterium]|nr:MAG: FAD-binding oxidoreductase [Deltaproteobacteria bacterium]
MTCDRRAVIIGAGITGTLTARAMSRAGWSVVLVEAAHVGAGSSSRTAAGIRQQWSTPEAVQGMRFSTRFYEQFKERTGATELPIRQNGYLFLAENERAWQAAQRRVQMQQEAGLTEVLALPTPALVERFPWIATDAVLGGTFCPSDGFLYPSLVYQESLRDAREHGARLIQGAPVEGCDVSGDRIVQVHTPKGSFGADVFLDCTNAWSRKLSRTLGAEELPVDALKRYLWFLGRDGALTGEQLSAMPLVITPPGVYCRPENLDTLLMGHAHPARHEEGFSYEDQDVIEPSFAHTGGLESAPFHAWEQLATYLPSVAEFSGIRYTTSGYYGTTPDHNPFFGYDRQRLNLVRLIGFSGHGAMFGPFSAQVGLQLCEAGHDLDAVEVEGESISLHRFKVGRAYDHHEAMVI